MKLGNYNVVKLDRIPFVALIVGIYGGLKAKQELPIKQQNFQWKNVGIAVVINFIVLVAIQLIMA